IYSLVLGIQEIALGQCLDSSVLARIQNQEIQSNPGSNPLKISEIFRALSDGIFSEVAAPPAAGSGPFAISTIRRNLQREYIKRLSAMVLGPRYDRDLSAYRFTVVLGGSSSVPPDAKNLARLHLTEIGEKISKLVGQKDCKVDDTTLAHLKDIQIRVERVLKAGLYTNEP